VQVIEKVPRLLCITHRQENCNADTIATNIVVLLKKCFSQAFFVTYESKLLSVYAINCKFATLTLYISVLQIFEANIIIICHLQVLEKVIFALAIEYIMKKGLCCHQVIKHNSPICYTLNFTENCRYVVFHGTAAQQRYDVRLAYS
jgi:hypothetical protein